MDKLGKICRVIWRDSAVFGGWRTIAEYEEMVADIMRNTITSVGYLLTKNSDYIVIIQSACNDLVSDATAIPMGCVVSVQELGDKDFLQS